MSSTTKSRRKACDFCVSRKIKCDGTRPVCANCTLHNEDCSITVAGKKRHRGDAQETCPTPRDRMEAIEARLATMESLLLTLTGTLTGPPPQDSFSTDVAIQQNLAVPDMYNFDTLGPLDGSQMLSIPPLSELLPVVDDYFQNLNPFMPLFDEARFTRMLLDWQTPSPKSMVPWAAVNVVQALTYRILQGRSMDDPALSQCLQNVRMSLAEIMMSAEDGLGLRVLLGLVSVYQGTTEFELGMMLMGSVVKMVQSLGHRGDLERVFEIAYILDRDVCLRSRLPYHDFGPDILDEESFDVVSSSRSSYLTARIRLSTIQTKAYDLAYNPALKLTPSERDSRRQQIDKMLRDFQSTTPEMSIPYHKLKPSEIIPVLHLYCRQFECLVKAHSIFTFDDVWLNRLKAYLLPQVIEVGDDYQLVQPQLGPLPSAWDECVRLGRPCLELFLLQPPSEHIILFYTCGLFSSLVILLVNMIEFPDHEHMTADRELVDKCMKLFGEMATKHPGDLVMAVMGIADDLDRRAKEVNAIEG